MINTQTNNHDPWTISLTDFHGLPDEDRNLLRARVITDAWPVIDRYLLHDKNHCVLLSRTKECAQVVVDSESDKTAEVLAAENIKELERKLEHPIFVIFRHEIVG